MTEPALNINAHDAAVRNRMKQCVLMPSNTPVRVPNTICAMTPKINMFRGLILGSFHEREKNIFEISVNHHAIVIFATRRRENHCFQFQLVTINGKFRA